jgi:N-acetylglucosamine-6-phosphate deacetylase
VAIVRRAADRRLCLVSDAIAAAGLGDGRFSLGGVEVEVSDGRSTTPDGTLAGSVGTMDAAVRLLVESGATAAEAVRAAGGDEGRTLARGSAADIAVLDDELRVTRTLVAGKEAFAR